MVRPTTRRAIVALLTGLLLVSVGSTTALAHEPDAEADGDPVELGGHDFRIGDLTVHLEDVHVTGTGLPEKSIDEATFTVDGEVTIDRFTFTVNGQEFEVGRTHIVLDDVGLTVENVSISNGSS